MIPAKRLCLLILILLVPWPALAHKINVFAWVSGDTVTVESSFAADRPLIKGSVTVRDKKSDTLLLEGTGDKKGIFTFTIPSVAKEQAMDLLITVAGGEGHQNQWLVPATEYMPDQLSAAPSPQPVTIATAVPAGSENTELKEMLRDVVREELAPMKRSLAKAQEQKPSFQDIMAGLGYLMGLAGLITWLQNRPRRDNSHT
jgi:nickel transport protein